MIVDVHTHSPSHKDVVPPEDVKFNTRANNLGPVRMTNTWADYDAGTAAADVTLVFNIQGRGDAQQEPGTAVDPLNRATAEFAAADPTRRIGFMSISPRFEGYLDEVDACVALGLRGIKLGANYQRFDPLGAPAMALYRRAQELGLPILFHQGTSPEQFAPLRYAHPMVTDEIAIAFPELRIVMAHMGHPWTRETVVTIRKHPNVYADISAMCMRPMMLYEAMTQATEWGVTDKLLFGSDFPIVTSQRTIDALRSVNDPVAGTGLPKISAEMIERIIHADALGALGLSVPASTTGS